METWIFSLSRLTKNEDRGECIETEENPVLPSSRNPMHITRTDKKLYDWLTLCQCFFLLREKTNILFLIWPWKKERKLKAVKFTCQKKVFSCLHQKYVTPLKRFSPFFFFFLAAFEVARRKKRPLDKIRARVSTVFLVGLSVLLEKSERLFPTKNTVKGGHAFPFLLLPPQTR